MWWTNFNKEPCLGTDQRTVETSSFNPFGVTFSGYFVFIRRCFNSISSPLISLGGNWKVLHIRLYCSQKKLFHNSHSLSILNTTILTMTESKDKAPLLWPMRIFQIRFKPMRGSEPSLLSPSLRGHFHWKHWLDKIEAEASVWNWNRSLTENKAHRKWQTMSMTEYVFIFFCLGDNFVFLSDCTQLRLARLSSFTASDDRGLGLYDPNGKQLAGEYLNILPKIYSLVHWNFGHRWHIRGKTDPNSMTSVGHCPKLGPFQRLLSLWLVTVQSSSVLIGLLWKYKKELSGFPLRTGHDWCLLRRKLSCRSQIENNINRFIFVGSFCLSLSKKPHKYILKDCLLTRIHRWNGAK